MTSVDNRWNRMTMDDIRWQQMTSVVIIVIELLKMEYWDIGRLIYLNIKTFENWVIGIMR